MLALVTLRSWIVAAEVVEANRPPVVEVRPLIVWPLPSSVPAKFASPTQPAVLQMSEAFKPLVALASRLTASL